MKKLTFFFLAVFTLGLSNVCAQTGCRDYSPGIKANTLLETDSLSLETDLWYGSTKTNIKLQVSLLAYSPNGQKRLLTFCNVTFGEDSPLNNIISNFANGDNVIENAPLPGNTIKDYFSEKPELYAAYLRQRDDIVKKLL